MSQLTDKELHELFDQLLDDLYKPVKICGDFYPASLILKKCSPKNYKLHFEKCLPSLKPKSRIILA